MPASQFITTSHRFWEETGKFTCLFSQFPWLQRLYDSLLDLSNIYLSPNPVHSELCIQVFANIPLFISYLCTSTYNGAISPPEPSPNSSACLWRPSLIQSCPPHSHWFLTKSQICCWRKSACHHHPRVMWGFPLPLLYKTLKQVYFYNCSLLCQ